MVKRFFAKHNASPLAHFVRSLLHVLTIVRTCYYKVSLRSLTIATLITFSRFAPFSFFAPPIRYLVRRPLALTSLRATCFTFRQALLYTTATPVYNRFVRHSLHSLCTDLRTGLRFRLLASLVGLRYSPHRFAVLTSCALCTPARACAFRSLRSHGWLLFFCAHDSKHVPLFVVV